MNRRTFSAVVLFFGALRALTFTATCLAEDLSGLKQNQKLSDFRVINLYSDQEGRVVATKLKHIPTGAPLFLLQIETVPQAFIWVDTPPDSNKGLPHSLEHLLAGKGVKGRYFELLRDMRFGQSAAATHRDFNFYGLASTTGEHDLFEQLHALLDALFAPDFTDAEAEREFYHFGVISDSATGKKTLIEKGSVYDEMQSSQGRFDYYFELNKRVLGQRNPFAYFSGGVPDEMRGVTPRDIRHFHDQYYSLGPATGFIFVLSPKESVVAFLQQMSRELGQWPKSARVPSRADGGPGEPKYAIHPTADTRPRIYPFPGTSVTDPGEIRFSWKPVKTESLIELRMLQLFFRGLAEGERSLLYQSLVDSKTRAFDSGATGVESEPFLGNSPEFPVWNVGISGIPGDRITLESIEGIRNLVLARIREISEYPDQSARLTAFNKLISAHAREWRRSERVWLKNPPGFGSGDNKTDWKEHFEVLEMDPSFVRSLPAAPVWQAIDRQLKSGKNVWRRLIENSHLLDQPYAAASAPSPRLFEDIEKARQDRIRDKLESLMVQYHTSDTQEALTRFEQAEMVKTKKIDQIEARVPRPHLSDHPPLTPDDDIRFRRFRLTGNVPVVATFFDRPPTMDIGLSFDLRQVPKKYYKYLSILPRSLDSLGTKQGATVIPYTELLAETRSDLYDFSVGYETNASSRRAELTIRASATSLQEFRAGLSLVRRMMQSSYLDESNASRLRDIVATKLADADAYTRKDESEWILNPAYAFRYQEDTLFLALTSQFTRVYWDGRLQWLLHRPVSAEEIEQLRTFADNALPSKPGVSAQELSLTLDKLEAKSLNAELVEYWKRNLASFPEANLVEGLRTLAVEAQQDLKTGPAKAIAEIKELQKIVLNRQGLHVDLTLNEQALDEIRPDLMEFLKSIPAAPVRQRTEPPSGDILAPPIIAKLKTRYPSASMAAPWHVGFVNPNGTAGSAIFYGDTPGYSQLDRRSLVHVLASNLFSGNGPQGFYIKAREAGLAYGISLTVDPGFRLTWFYADRSPDLPSLVNLSNSTAARAPDFRDDMLLDYTLRQSLPLPRSTLSSTERGKALAQDIRDGNTPEKIRRFSEAVLRLRQDPNLFSELTQAGFVSICGVLLDEKCLEQQRASRSLFFFVGPARVLDDVESRLPMPRLLRVWPSDYWVE